MFDRHCKTFMFCSLLTYYAYVSSRLLAGRGVTPRPAGNLRGNEMRRLQLRVNGMVYYGLTSHSTHYRSFRRRAACKTR